MARLFRGDSGEPIIVIGGDSSSTYNSFGKKTSTEKQSAVVVDVLFDVVVAIIVAVAVAEVNLS